MEALATVEIPSNKKINKKLDSAEDALEETRYEQKNNLTADGQKMIDKAENIIDNTKAFVNARNPNDTLKQIVQESQAFYNEVQTNYNKWHDLQQVLQNPQNKVDTNEILKQMQSMSRTARLVAIELISSGEFRQTIFDFFSVLYASIIDASHIDRIGKPLGEAFDSLVNDKTEKTTDKLKEAGSKAVELGLDYMDTDKQVFTLSDDQRKQLWTRFREVLGELSKRERSQRMIHSMFEIMDLLYRPFNDVTNKVQSSSDKILNDQHIQNIFSLSQQLFEAFTRTNLDIFLSHCKVMYTSIAEDEQLKKQIWELRDWILRVIENPELLGDEQTYKKFNWIVDDLSRTIQGKRELKFNFTVMRDELNKIIWMMENDPLTTSIQRDVKDLVQMIFLDNQGRVTFKPEMLDQLKLIVLSAVVKRLKVPLPEVRADDPNASFAFKVSGLIMSMQDILPERVIAENRGIAVLNVKDKTIEKNLGKRCEHNDAAIDKAAEAIRIRLENINVHMHDADIWFHKKSFPEAEDTGKADIDIGGNGMDLSFVFKTEMGSDRLFTLVSVDCDIHDLKLKLHNTTHDTFYNMFITLFKGTVKSNIEEAIQESMVGIFENLNKQIEAQVKTLRANIPTVGSLVASIH